MADESANANIILWPPVFENNRRTILSASMLGCRGKAQRASGVIHMIVESVSDLTADLKRVSGLDAAFPLVAGRSDEARHGGGWDSREGKPLQPKPRDTYVPDLHISRVTSSLSCF
jgi:error-prone DNA polymerase